MRFQGTITEWNDEKGYGFVTPESGGPRVFIHIKAFVNRRRRPVGHELVSYELSIDSQGRPQGLHVAMIGDRRTSSPTAPGPGPVALSFAGGFLAFAVMSAMVHQMPVPLAILDFVASGIAFVVYAVDKVAALSGTRRTPEKVLHLISLLGGWPGALVAQKTLRHKTQKQPFQGTFWGTVILNCAMTFWLISPLGRHATQALSDGVSVLKTSVDTEQAEDSLPLIRPL